MIYHAVVRYGGWFVPWHVWIAAADESEEERLKRLDQEQAKVDKEKGKLEYYAAITEEGHIIISYHIISYHVDHLSVVVNVS